MYWLLHFRKSPDDYNDTDCLSISPAGSTSSSESGKRAFQDSPPKFPDINDPSPPPMMGHTGKWSTMPIPCYFQVCFRTPQRVIREFKSFSCQRESLIIINFLNSCNHCVGIPSSFSVLQNARETESVSDFGCYVMSVEKSSKGQKSWCVRSDFLFQRRRL